MRKLMSLFIVFGLLCIFSVGSLFAGVEPSPFQPLTNKVEAVELVFQSVEMSLNRVLMDQPKMPNPHGIVGQLDAIGNQLMVINKRLGKIKSSLPMDEITVPFEMIDALYRVLEIAEDVASRAEDGFDEPPPIPGSCETDADCPDGYCVFNICVPDNAAIPRPCSTNEDCPPLFSCFFSICLCIDYEDCTTDININILAVLHEIKTQANRAITHAEDMIRLLGGPPDPIDG